ncbi:MAG: hypothetical protein RIR52_407 [Acidobacteriota bacterium]|jgi:hypothetical protein
MRRDKDQSEWVILSFGSEAGRKDLVRLLRADGIVPERLTTVRIDGDPAPSFWDGQRRSGRGEQAAVVERSVGGLAGWLTRRLLPVLGVGVLSLGAGWWGLFPPLTFGFAVMALALTILFVWQYRISQPSGAAATTPERKSSHAVGATFGVIGVKRSADPVMEPMGSSGIEATGVGRSPATILIGLKIGRTERSRVEQIAIESGAGQITYATPRKERL